MRAWKLKFCKRCGKEYQPTSGHQSYCADCGIEAHRDNAKDWRAKNHDRAMELNHRWFSKHPENMAANGHRYYVNNKEKVYAQVEAWRIANPEKALLSRKKQVSKHRSLGFHPLNSPFPNSEGHHINQSDVIYIPLEMHKSVSHNVWAGRNMERINALAGAYLTEDWT
jgi:ribosomal protein L37E